MKDSSTYSVVTSGEIQPGFDISQVQCDFAELFKIPSEKAEMIVGKKKVLKSNLSIKKAQAYRLKLERIGLVVKLKEKAVDMSSSLSLALEPTEDELNAPSTLQEKVQIKAPVDDDNIDCPKCHLTQAKAEQCIGCGIYIKKLMPMNQNILPAEGEQQTTEPADEEVADSEDDAISSKALLVASAVALVGALVWKFIAVAFDYELGIVAWLIGGAVGYAAAMFGSRGQYAGIACGVLTVIAIMGGKYMAMESIQAEWSKNILEQVDKHEFNAIYEEEIRASKTFVADVTDEATLRQFMVDYGYSDFSEVNEVLPEEMSDFNEYVAPNLESTAYNPPTFEQWWQASFQSGIEDLSTWDLMEESLGIIDLVFLLLGVATAYRLGSRQES